MNEINLQEIIKQLVQLSKDLKFQISAALAFGSALILLLAGISDKQKLALVILFLFPTALAFLSVAEKVHKSLSRYFRHRKYWKNLTPAEKEIIARYIEGNTKTIYFPAYNGTYRDSGIINPLVHNGILYLASRLSEFRGESWMSAEQHFPFNMQDKAFEYFKSLKNNES